MGLLSNLFGKSKRNKIPRVDIEKRFTLHNRLGQGSMSKVWRATDLQTGRQVCLKILDMAKLEALKKRFVGMNRPDEGEVAISLVHPNIVRTYEHGVSTRNEEFLVMELVEGSGLNFLIDTKSKQLIGHEIEILLQVAEAVAYFHERNYIHRDICPRNILVSNQNVVKLIDFGLAVPNTKEFRRPGNRTGSANYMAPELIRRAPTDQRIDLFSLGVTAYETFTGGLPWESSTESLQAMLDHINNQGRDPRDLNPDLDEATATFLLKAIERDPNKRFQTAREFAKALRRLRGDEMEEEAPVSRQVGR